MAVFLTILKLIVAFIALAATSLWIGNIVFEAVNPQILIENGDPYVKQRNSKVITGLVAALFWAILISVF